MSPALTFYNKECLKILGPQLLPLIQYWSLLIMFFKDLRFKNVVHSLEPGVTLTCLMYTPINFIDLNTLLVLIQLTLFAASLRLRCGSC